MWPITHEYRKGITDADYKKFSPNTLKEYKDISIGFFAACSYHPTAWDKTFESIRNCFCLLYTSPSPRD